MDFTKNHILENHMVRLSPLQPSDLDHLIHFAVQEPELWKYSLLQANSPQKMKVYLHKALEGRQHKTTYPFLVFDKRSGKVAGSTRFYDIQLENAALQLGFTWYGKEFQGSGLNKNCKFLLLQFAFEELHMERVEFRADLENERSIQAMKSIGCTAEGLLRSNTYKPDGTRRDSIVLSILKNEWHDSVKQALKDKIGA